MKSLYASLSVLVFLLFSSPLFDLDYYWVNGDGVWSDIDNHEPSVLQSGDRDGQCDKEDDPGEVIRARKTYFSCAEKIQGRAFPSSGTSALVYCMEQLTSSFQQV